MILNFSKTKEIAFRRPNPKLFLFPRLSRLKSL